MFEDNVLILSSSWTAGPLKMRVRGCPKTTVWNHHSTLHKIPEQRRPHLHYSKSLKLRRCEINKNMNWYKKCAILNIL